MQPTHDRVNQCHGSQSGCLALLKQACGGPDREKKSWNVSTFSSEVLFLYEVCLKCHMQPFQGNICPICFAIKWTLAHLGLSGLQMYSTVTLVDLWLNCFCVYFNFSTLINGKADFLSAARVCTCVRACVRCMVSHVTSKQSVTPQLCCDMCKWGM